MNQDQENKSGNAKERGFWGKTWNKVVALWHSGPTGKAICIGVVALFAVIGMVADDDERSSDGRRNDVRVVQEQRSSNISSEIETSEEQLEEELNSSEQEKPKKKSSPARQGLGIVFLLVGFFSLFMCKQSVGRGRLNDILTSFGHGSFLEGVMAAAGRLFWGLLSFVGIIGGLSMLS